MARRIALIRVCLGPQSKAIPRLSPTAFFAASAHLTKWFKPRSVNCPLIGLEPPLMCARSWDHLRHLAQKHTLRFLSEDVESESKFLDIEAMWKPQHGFSTLHIVFRPIALHSRAHAAAVASHLVAYLSTEQSVDEDPLCLSRQIPKSHLNGTDGAASRFETP